MLERLAIQDFAVARSVTIEPGPGLNVFTGETGAGKSLIVDAMAFLFGARRGRDVIATGAERATVEAVVVVDGARRTVERSISLSGRSNARLDGAPVSLDEIQALGGRLVDIHGQSGQLAILRPAAQLAALDAFAGLDEERARLAGHVRAIHEVRRDLRELSASGQERERLLDQLRFEADEIEAAALTPGEDESLHAERSRLASAGQLLESSGAALAALDSGSVDEALAAVAEILRRDPAAPDLEALADALETAALDLRRALRGYRDSLEDDPERLAAVEERLDRIARLKRKYGATIEDVLEYGRATAARLQLLESSAERVETLRARETELLHEAASAAMDLSLHRRAAAGSLCGAIRAELDHLGMGGAALAVGFSCEDSEAGLPVRLPDYEVLSAAEPTPLPDAELLPRAFTESGVDRVEFLASFNSGESPHPLSAVASGGEASRFLLALASVLGSAAEPRIVIFDEVDEGVGGRAGSLVGEAVARLARRHQVLCVTHLPQVAAFGANHFVVSKRQAEGATSSEVVPVSGEARIEELAAMLGQLSDASRKTARELLAAAQKTLSA